MQFSQQIEGIVPFGLMLSLPLRIIGCGSFFRQLIVDGVGYKGEAGVSCGRVTVSESSRVVLDRSMSFIMAS